MSRVGKRSRARAPDLTRPRNARTLWPLLKRIYDEFFEDSIPTVAGGITFFALLALFPAISATVSLFGIFSHHAEISRDVDLVSGFLPGGAVTIFGPNCVGWQLRSRLPWISPLSSALLSRCGAQAVALRLWLKA